MHPEPPLDEPRVAADTGIARELPAISFVMPVLNEEEHITAAVGAVLGQEYPGEVELVLALGPSTDGTAAAVEALQRADPRIRTVANPEGTIPSGLNAALAAARHSIVVRVDAHTEIPPHYARDGVRSLLESGATIVGGVMAARGRTPLQTAVAWSYRSRFGLGGPAYHVGGEAGPAESAYLGIFRREEVLAIGGYAPDVLRGEDWYLCRRLIDNGGMVWFDPGLEVTYWPRASVRRLAQQFFATGTWRGDITRRDPLHTSPRYLAPPALVVSVAGGLLIAASGRPLGLAPALAYGAGVLSVALTASMEPAARTRLLLVLPVMHLTWGAGFWRGLVLGAGSVQDRGRL